MLAAMRNYVWIALPALLLAAACEEKPAAKPTEPTPAASTASEPAAEQPKREPVEDFDVAGLKEEFKCPNKTNAAVCEVIEGFAGGTKWNFATIQGKDARYFGKAVVRKGGELQERWVFLVVKKVPLNEVTEGDLPLKIALRELDESQTAEINHADKLMWKLRRDDAVTKSNQTANYILGYAPSKWDSAAQTKGESVIFHIGGGAFVRQGEKRTLQLVKLEAAKPGASSADGLFVRLYPLSW